MSNSDSHTAETQVPLNPEARTYKHESSPVKNTVKHYAEHDRAEVQAFGYDGSKSLEFDTADALINFLKQGQSITIPSPPEGIEFSKDEFCEAANPIATLVRERDFPDSPLLVFEVTKDDAPGGHCVGTSCRPDFVAAWQDDFIDGKKGKKPPIWPYIRLVGEDGSKGKSRNYQDGQAKSYLHYLLLARPDLHVALGMLTTKTHIRFQVGIGGHGIQSLMVQWTSKDVFRLMYAFIYRLYDPGNFADPTYVVEPPWDPKCATYTITINTKVDSGPTGEQRPVACRRFVPLSASNPFGTRTHVLFNLESDVVLNHKKLLVIKDQLSHIGTRFDENAIIEHIHKLGTVPGVIQAAHYEEIELPLSERVCRSKRRLGMWQHGTTFRNISTALEMLYTAYDLLEVLRHLRVHRQVLHRDISSGNVLYVPLLEDQDGPEQETVADESTVALAFIRGLLDPSVKPQVTSTLSIDLNRAENLETEVDRERVVRTGTPLFIARALQRGMPAPPPKHWAIPAIPPSPDIYTSKHPDRVNRFPEMVSTAPSKSRESDQQVDTRHELDHDVESVFWLVFYWAMSAQPIGLGDESITASTWNLFIGTARERGSLLKILNSSETTTGTFHSAFDDLLGLTEALAEIIEVDRHWYDDGDPRNNPEFFVEAFQRLILRFIIANRGKKIMTLPIDPEPRVPAEGSRGLSLTRTSLAVSTSNQGTSSGKKRSRDIRDNEDKGGEGGQEGNEGEEGAQRNDDKRKRRRARTEVGINEAGTSEQGTSDE